MINSCVYGTPSGTVSTELKPLLESTPPRRAVDQDSDNFVHSVGGPLAYFGSILPCPPGDHPHDLWALPITYAIAEMSQLLRYSRSPYTINFNAGQASGL